MHNTKLKLAMVAATLLTTGLMLNTANAANHREAPITALNKIDDVTDWYTFVDPADASRVVIAGNYDGLSVPSNGPNYFPFSPETLYEFRIDNNHDATDDIIMQFRFSSLDNGITTTNPIRENFTGYAGIGGDACFGGVNALLPGLLSVIPQVCTPSLGLPGGGHQAPVNAPPTLNGLNGNFGTTGTVIQPQINNIGTGAIGTQSPGLGLAQTYQMRIIRATGPSAGQVLCQTGDMPVLPSNVGSRTFKGYVGLHYDAAPRNLRCQNGDQVKVFAGTTDDAFPVNLGGAFDTINLPLACGGGANISAAEVTQGELGNCGPNQVDGFNVNSIVVSVPTTMLTAGGSPVIGTYGATTRSRVRVLNLFPGRQATFVGPNGPVPNGPYAGSEPDLIPRPAGSAPSRVQIARMGHPLFNEVIVGTGCKDWFSTADADTDAFVNNCNFNDLKGSGITRQLGSSNGSHPDITSFLRDPVLPRLVNALIVIPNLLGGGGVVGALNIPTTLQSSGLRVVNSRYVATPGGIGGVFRGRSDMNVFGTYTGFIKEMGELGATTAGTPVIGIDPVSDLLRLDTRIPNNKSLLLRKRMGPLDITNACLLGSGLLCNLTKPLTDFAGWPNGRRLSDDVIDGVLRAEMGVLDPAFLLGVHLDGSLPNAASLTIGDATQGNDLGYLNNPALRTDLQGYGTQFPYFAPAQDGVRHRAINALEIGCPLAPGAICAAN